MSSSSGIPERFPNGSIMELFRFPTAAALLLDYETGQTVRLLGLGLFYVDLVVRTASPILATFCSVNGFQWPLTKDSPIIRICKRTFIFGLPGLLYALQFPWVCEETLIDSLEKVFTKFGHYEDFGDPATGGPGYPCVDNEPSLWTTVRPVAEPKAHEILSRFGHEPGRSRFSVLHHNSCYTRATRMSATTKTIVQALISGSLKPAHISIKGTDASFNLASPSITVFTCLVDAVEASWLFSFGLSPLIVDTQPPLRTSYPSPGFRVWRLNEMGLATFIQGLHSAAEREEEMLSARTAINDDKDKEKGEASHALAVDKAIGKQDKP